MENVTIFNHPLIQHKISILRNKNTGTNEFRSLIEEIAMLMGYEALRDLPTEEVEVETPIETCMTPMIAGKKLADGKLKRIYPVTESRCHGKPANRSRVRTWHAAGAHKTFRCKALVQTEIDECF